MKLIVKKLYVLLVMMAVSVGAWADDFYLSKGTWFSNVPAKTQNVLKISLCKENGGALQSAITTITADGWKLDGLSLTDFKVVYIDLGNGQPNDAYAMNDDDISALSNLNFETIDLQDAYYKKNGVKAAFKFTNRYVQNLILPDNWTKEEVNACASEVGINLGAALSQSPIDESTATAIAYVCKPGTLVNTTQHVFFDQKPNSKLGNLSNVFQSFNYVKNLVISGYASARDFSGVHEGLEYDANGHFIFDKAADETSDVRNAAVGGGTRTLVGSTTKVEGAWYGASLVTLDLENLILEDVYNDDLNLSKGGLLGAETKRVIIPTYSGLHTLPADFLNVDGNKVSQICIPGNITTIRTRAFMSTPLYHVWTTVGNAGPVVVDDDGNDATVYDNGTWLDESEEAVFGYQDINLIPADFWYGTYTLPPGLELIESRAFANTETHIKDVYSLSIKAPECHVDAFSIGGYIANNSMAGVPVDGIITREAYAKSVQDGTWITMLHYPRESTTPDIQRYTDVTRDYSIATGLRDGKGATIYFPTQSEFNRAYLQGTFGYVWDAWDPTRDANNAVSYPGTGELAQYSQSLQVLANQGYLDNNAEGIDKTDRSFFDVTDLNNLDQPAGLDYYYNTEWEGKQLYPQAETTGTGIIRYVEVLDANGNRQYDVDNVTPGEYIKIGSYVEDEDGNFVKNYIVSEDGEFVKENIEAYVKAENGTYYHDAGYVTPYTDGTEFVEDCTYSENAKGDYYLAGEYLKGWKDDNTTYYEVTFVQNDNGDYVKTSWGAFITKEQADSPDYAWMQYTDKDRYSIAYQLWDGTPGKELYYFVANGYELWSESVGNVTRYNKNWDGTSYREKTSDDYDNVTVYSYFDNGYKEYNEGVGEVDALYNKVDAYSYRPYDSSIDGDDVTRYTVDGYTNYTDQAGLQRYSIQESFGTNLSDGQFQIGTDKWTVRTEPIEIQEFTKSNDYRGWHQFVLTSYAANSNVPMIPYRSYITDSDWWTICLPFDLTKAELIKLFGTEGGGTIPYLSKLQYVIRDVEQKIIVLTFSKNLLENKEVVADNHVHGEITTDPVGDDDIVLHAGVPYLIRPFLQEGAPRQFDIKSTGIVGDLYDRIVKSQELGGSELNELIYDGVYTVPAYVVNDNGTESVSDGEITFTMADGSSFTHAKDGTTDYNGTVVDYKLSTDFCYSFVGTFYLSQMPINSYFLGWDSTKNRAAFWYNRVNATNEWTWNNETGIILPNFITSKQKLVFDFDNKATDQEISPATNLSNPARWKIELAGSDDFASDGVKNNLTSSQFGYEAKLWEGDATVIIRVDDDKIEQPVNGMKGVFNLGGQYMGNSVEGLQKGIYIVNGKKYVIK